MSEFPFLRNEKQTLPGTDSSRFGAYGTAVVTQRRTCINLLISLNKLPPAAISSNDVLSVQPPAMLLISIKSVSHFYRPLGAAQE